MKRTFTKQPVLANDNGPFRQDDIEAFLIDYMVDTDHVVDDQPLRDVIIRLINLRTQMSLNEIKDMMYEEGLNLVDTLDLIESRN